MIQTDIDIKDGIFDWLREAPFVGALSGSLYKDRRPLNSDKEDIVIAVLARDAGPQIQLATVNVNIYIPDVRRGKEAVEDAPRLREISRLAADYMEYHNFGRGIYELDSQEILKANGIDWHVINNRLSVRFNNELE